MKHHSTKQELLHRLRIESKAFIASGRAVKLIALIILEKEFEFDPDGLKTFLECFEDTLDYYNQSKDYQKLLTEWDEYFIEELGQSILNPEGDEHK